MYLSKHDPITCVWCSDFTLSGSSTPLLQRSISRLSPKRCLHGSNPPGKWKKKDQTEDRRMPEISYDGIEIEIVKTGKNSRRIVSKLSVRGSLQTVWDILTDYEGLAGFIPSLAVSRLLEKRDGFARVFQIGEQDLALGLKVNAKCTIDCFERDLQAVLNGLKRDIEFKMVEGDFQVFEGKWSVEQRNSRAGEEFQTTLLYDVNVKPKMWLPVRLVEGRLCREIRKNISCIREQVEKAAFQIANPLLQ